MEDLTRRNVRHMIIRARNGRIVEQRDDSWPRLLLMHPDTLSELLVDDDPAERLTLDFLGETFLGIPVMQDPRLTVGHVALDWPVKEVSADGA